jgi:ADP-dependent NAD(P)H-hydrate dehydratase / NAD(P)H-hydrate epimerase
MTNTYWRKQEEDSLFPDIVWSRPESKNQAGKLAIIGGNSHGFGAPGMAYNIALEAGAGICRVLLPDAIKKIVKSILPDADFALSTPSGSFSRQALDALLQIAQWSDAVLLPGDVGRNSETAMLLESFVEKYKGMLTITQDAVDYFKETPAQLLDRDKTLIVLSLAQLQKIFSSSSAVVPITLGMNTAQLVDALHDFTQIHPACIVTSHNEMIFVAFGGQIITTKHEEKTWRVKTASRASVFWLQNPNKMLEAVVSSLAK